MSTINTTLPLNPDKEIQKLIDLDTLGRLYSKPPYMITVSEAREIEAIHARLDIIHNQGPDYLSCDIHKALKRERVVIDEIIAGLEAGEYGVVSAPGGVGKSYLMLLAAVQMAVGLPILNNLLGPARSGGQPVIYISCEDNPTTRLQNRLSDILDELQIHHCDDRPDSRAALLRRNLIICNASSFVARLPRGLPVNPECKPRLIIVDTYRTFAPELSENDTGENTKLLNVLRSHALDLGACFLLIHHTNKMALGNHSRGESTAGQERGASSIRDNARAAWSVWPPSPIEIKDLNLQNPKEIVIMRSSKMNHGSGDGEQWFRKNHVGVPIPIDKPCVAATPGSPAPASANTARRGTPYCATQNFLSP